ncbi:hypothetical protein DSECCO2_561080 [anaerobic digester metagenome]
MRLGEIEFAVPFSRIEHALNRVDLTPFQIMQHAGPGPETDFDVKTHLLGDHPGELDIETGRVPVFVQILERRVAMIAAHDDAAVLRQFQGGEPPGVKTAIGAVGDDDGQPFVQQGQHAAVAFFDGETEVLAKVLDGLVDDPQVRESGLRDEAQRHQTLHDHGVVAPLGQIVQGLLKGGGGRDQYAAVFPTQELLGVVALHDGHATSPEIGQALDILRPGAHHDGPVQGHVGHREIEELFALGRAADQGQGLHLALFQPASDLGPRSCPKCNATAHGGQGGTQNFHGKTVGTARFIDNGKRRVIYLGGGGDGRGRCGCAGSLRRLQGEDEQYERQQWSDVAPPSDMNIRTVRVAGHKENSIAHFYRNTLGFRPPQSDVLVDEFDQNLKA